MTYNHSHDDELHQHFEMERGHLGSDAWLGLHQANTVLVRLAVPPLLVVTFLGTILVLLGLRRASIPCPHRCLLYTLLGADLLALAVTTPRNYATTAFHTDILAYVPVSVCQLWYAASVSAIYIPAYTQLALTLERCFAVLRPLDIRRLFTARSVTCGLTVTVLTICIGALCLTSRVHHYPTPSPASDAVPTLCHMAPLQALVLSYVNLVLWLTVPLSSLIVCNVLIISCLRQSQPSSIHLHPISRRRLKERRLALILVTLSVVYCAAISPFTIYSMYMSVKSYKDLAVLPLDEVRGDHVLVSGFLHDDIIWIVTLNCTMIPLLTDWIILFMMSSDIRRHVAAIFGVKKKRDYMTDIAEFDTVSGEISPRKLSTLQRFECT